MNSIPDFSKDNSRRGYYGGQGEDGGYDLVGSNQKYGYMDR